MLETNSTLWILFSIFVVGALILDLGVLNRKVHTPTFRESLYWCICWVSLALIFTLGLYWKNGSETAILFLTGYLVELSLSVDNIFVFIMIFSFFKVAKDHQHKILFWGIVGAVVCRAAFILAGLQLVSHFEWVFYILGLFLVGIGVRMAVADEDPKADPEHSAAVRLFRWIFPVTEKYHGDKFFVRENGRLKGTPLMVVLVAIETTDVIFALDSIPAVIAVTQDPFIVFTSNIFAILGLRSIYFLIASAMTLFHHLRYGVSALLVFIGSKMLLAEYISISVYLTLAIILAILAISIVASMLHPPKKTDSAVID